MKFSLWIVCALLFPGVAAAQLADPTAPLFTTDIVAAPEGRLLTTNKGDKSLRLYDTSFDKPLQIWNFSQTPTGVAVSGDKAYVTTFEDKGMLNVVDLKSGKVEKEIYTGHGATSPVVSPDGSKVYVLNQFGTTVVEVDPEAGQILRSVRVLREPKGAVVSPDGKYLFVTNFLPEQRADLDYVAADVSVIELAGFTKIKDIKLANGSNALRGIAISPDGKYVFVSHNMGRFAVPTSQLQQGWMNTSAMSIIDANKLTFEGGVVLDDPEHGAAGIWDVKFAGDKILITHSGTHDISVIDYPALDAKLSNYTGTQDELSYDLRFMYGLRERLPLQGNGPRKLAVIGDTVYIPTYFSDILNVLSLADNSVAVKLLVPNRKETVQQAGERIFNDATYCFQNWQSCNGCHPGDARTDGMNWDLMNDGIGNPKNCKSLLYSHITPPSMISGIRVTAELAVRKGFTHIQFHDIPEDMAVQVDEYLKGLKAVSSPYLVEGQLSEKAQAGRKVFEKFNCGECHSGPRFTDMKMHRIGEDIEFEKGWDTPTLNEVWRTAPYLFDGRAATMREVFEVHKHGIKGKITPKELDQLVEYVNSL